jgi:hypothetical protein
MRVGVYGLVLLLAAGCGSDKPGTTGRDGGSTVVHTTTTTTTPPSSGSTKSAGTEVYQPLVNPSELKCPSIDSEYTSSAPGRWRVCATKDRSVGTLINISDDVEVFAGPSTTVLLPIRFDNSASTYVVRGSLTALKADVVAENVRDPAAPTSGHFEYMLPGDKIVFAGKGESLSQITAATSLKATIEAGVARTMAAAAYEASYSGTVRTSQTPAQFVLGLANPISKCANGVNDALTAEDLATQSLTDLVATSIEVVHECKSAVALFSVSKEDQALRRATDTALTFRVKTIGRHALEESGFWEDIGKGLLTGLEHIRP